MIKKATAKKAKTVKQDEEQGLDNMPINVHLYTSLLSENKILRAEVADLKSKLEDEKAALNRLKSSRADVLEKVGLKDRIKNLFNK